MALCKQLTTEFGITANYHKISLININWHIKECEVQLDSYVSKEAREQGASPIITRRFFYLSSRPNIEDNFDFDMEQNIVAQLYAKIKLESDFTNATDC